MPARIEVNEGDLRAASGKALRAILVVGIVVGVTLLGYFVTPRDPSGNLLFLSPRVAQVDSYQHHVQQWAREMRDTEGQMQSLLSAQTADLYAQDSALQDINRNVSSLSDEVDRTSAPDSLAGLHDLMAKAAEAHQQASSALGQWLGAPSPETQAAARNAIEAASGILEQVYTNPWVTVEREATPEDTNGNQ
jgi:hypothetical protein